MLQINSDADPIHLLRSSHVKLQMQSGLLHSDEQRQPSILLSVQKEYYIQSVREVPFLPKFFLEKQVSEIRALACIITSFCLAVCNLFVIVFQ
ncbi:hypothetical protein D3C84_1097100 [compost metagenome]